MASSAAPARSLTAATVHGVKWTTGASITTALLQVGYTAVMARLLTPAEFGLVALAGVILRFGSYFAQMGMEQAIIQKPDITTQDVRAAFTSSALLGALFTAILVVGAPLAVAFFHEPKAVPVVRVLALGLLLTGLNATALSLLRRQMRFQILAIIEVAAYVLSYGGIGIVMAWAGFGVWALVGAQVGQLLLLTVMAYAAARHSLLPIFQWAVYRPLVAYGSRMSAISFLEFLTGSLDTLLIGRLLNAAALGLYNRAWMLIGLPIYLLTSSIAKVIFPSFSQLQHDRPKLREVYLSSIMLIGAVVMPTCAGAAMAAPEIVLVMLGPKWLEAAPILQMVCVAFSMSMVTMFAGVVCDATATLTPKLILNIGYTALLPLLFVMMAPYGLVGVAAAVVMGEVVRTILYMSLMNRVLAVAPLAVLRSYVPGLTMAAAVALVLGLVMYGLRTAGAPLPVRFGLALLTGAVTAGGLLLFWPPEPLRALLVRIVAKLSLPTTGWAAAPAAWLMQRLGATLAPAAAAPVVPYPAPSARRQPALSPDPEAELV
ncbi:lipopolysaccharide biosynthesis protein [Hymenobacter oligotrophus]|uniref:Lipopolysaccharide biosynthesis protein n=1 Tax=Hymenobacter oligotrophus TaxID=2319843 RepID=A0A3B7QYF9_9BACT|nr:lipopolysaccharide biosynthesis protein [Hymenobacter oligotrophus]AYA36874.1 lipopolysaccharide biosynthesis protein [Hymenobacter oligotrophus]